MYYSQIKRVLDILFLLFVLPIIIPTSLIVFILLKLESFNESVFFIQERLGKDNKPFKIIKFRTMYSDNNSKNNWTEKNDSRITVFGKILRRTRIDEIPQFFNILKNDMSLIGPRPEQPEIVSRYLKSIPFYGFRHVVRPGISGWAQVVYHYAASDEETMRKLEYDFFYIKNMSLWLDFVVLLRTTVTIMLGKGAR